MQSGQQAPASDQRLETLGKGAGALLGLYSTPTQVGEDAADAVLDLIAGRPRPALSPPQRFEVGVNNTVARALGLELPTAESLMRELRRVEASAP